jgi:hypothetical protein
MKPPTVHQKLILLLQTLEDAQTSWHTGTGNGGPQLMPSAYHQGSYPELEAALRTMRDNPTTRPWWWPLNQRYRWGTLHRTKLTYRRTIKGPRPQLPPNTELINTGTTNGQTMQATIYRWTPTVDHPTVSQALDHLASLLPHPRLPPELQPQRKQSQ